MASSVAGSHSFRSVSYSAAAALVSEIDRKEWLSRAASQCALAAGLSPPPASSLGLPQCDVKATLRRLEADQQREMPRFEPKINSSSARMRRDMPVEEVLIGKGLQWQQRREKQRENVERAKQAASAREGWKPSRSTEQMAQRYGHRVGRLSAQERLFAPAPSLRRLEHERREQASRAASPPKASRAGDGLAAVARTGSGADAFHTIPRSAGGASSRGSGTPGTMAVAERNAAWAQLREHRLQQAAHRQRHADAKVCTFQPASDGAGFLARTYGGSTLDLVSRNLEWQASRDSRLQAAREEIVRAEIASVPGVPPPRKYGGVPGAHPPPPIVAWSPGPGMPEPNFMVPTCSMPGAPECLQTFDDQCVVEHLPEWAAPRGAGFVPFVLADSYAEAVFSGP